MQYQIIKRVIEIVVYKIPYRRAPRLACRVRRANKRYLAYNRNSCPGGNVPQIYCI